MISQILTSLICLLISNSAINNDIYLKGNQEKLVPSNGVLSGTVTKSKDLPQELYGTWSVSSVVLETNQPELYRGKVSDIWTLQKNQDTITLTNPSTGATASITVDEVKGNTATFTRTANDGKVKEYEQVKITVVKDNFWGSDTIKIEYYNNKGKYLYTSSVKYDVTGKKITAPVEKDIFSDWR
jgi:hypothetical protein